MINVVFKFNADGLIESMSIEGHAFFAESGNDIICASASTLLYTAINALEDLCGLTGFYQIQEESKKSKVPKATITIPQEELAKGKETPVSWVMSVIHKGFITLGDADENKYASHHIRVKEKYG